MNERENETHVGGGQVEDLIEKLQRGEITFKEVKNLNFAVHSNS